jgi:ABC-type polysaccharide/polyol phosphate transport system ATPase subunit
MSYAVEIQNLSKSFRLYQEKYSSLKERVVHAGHIPYDEFWALKDVEASFEAGQTIGMLGRNGSGKSTLLKCIAGILQPSSGQVVVRGKVAAMLELGAGFAHDLSGRDNVYLNGTLLGMSRKEIRRRFDEIVAFAELEQFIDNQVKYYSSGMIVRLGFAVAISMEPDVLLVDEVLAVGDERFQQKCLERVSQLQQEGRTIVVVSHAPDMMREMCDVILVLDHGLVVSFGKPGEAIRAFREGLLETPGLGGGEAGAPAANLRQVEITGASVDYEGAGERPYAITGEPLTVHVDYLVRSAVDAALFEIEIFSDASGRIYLNRTGAEESVTLAPGAGSVSFRFDAMPLLDGRYTVNFSLRNAGGVVLAIAEPACAFEVMNPGRSLGVVDLPMRVELSAPGEMRSRPAI